jgi:hypothetical protein
MNLENLNLVELNAQEVQEVEGGNPFIQGLTYILLLIDAAHDASGCTGHSGTYVNQGGVVVANVKYH